MGIEARSHRLPVPHVPRTPHIPHARGIALAMALVLAGTAATGTWVRNNEATQPNPRPGAIDPEHMSFPYWKQLLNVTMSLDGEPVEQLTTTPQVLRANDSFYVPVFTPEYGNPNDPKNVFGNITIIGLNEVMKGGAMLRESDAQGNPKKDSNGEFIYITPDQVKNLEVPEQVQGSMLA